jgi:hypothetical protein
MPSYDLTPVEHDPWADAQTHAAEPPNPAAPAVDFGKAVAKHYWDKAVSALTAPRDALTGAMQVTDPDTGMPTPEAMQRAHAVANLVMTGGMPMAERGAAGMAGGKLTPVDHNPFEASGRIDFQSSGAQRGEAAGAKRPVLTDEELAAARARSDAYQARLRERLAAKAKEPAAPAATSPGGERIGFKSLETKKGEPEKVIGAAVVGKDGQIFTASNHLLARDKAAAAYGVDRDDVWGHLDEDVPGGFMTSKGRVVDRNEAGRLSGQQGPMVK